MIGALLRGVLWKSPDSARKNYPATWGIVFVQLVFGSFTDRFRIRILEASEKDLQRISDHLCKGPKRILSPTCARTAQSIPKRSPTHTCRDPNRILVGSQTTCMDPKTILNRTRARTPKRSQTMHVQGPQKDLTFFPFLAVESKEQRTVGTDAGHAFVGAWLIWGEARRAFENWFEGNLPGGERREAQRSSSTEGFMKGGRLVTGVCRTEATQQRSPSKRLWPTPSPKWKVSLYLWLDGMVGWKGWGESQILRTPPLRNSDP